MASPINPNDAAEQKYTAKNEEMMDVDDEEEDEAMDVKAKALTNLLKTSSVFVAIMADKMKDQQKQQQEKAKREAAKKQKAEAAETDQPKQSARRSTRAQDNAADLTEEEPKKLPTRGRPKRNANANKKGITDYFKQEDVQVDKEGPSVQQALEEAADQYQRLRLSCITARNLRGTSSGADG